MEINKIIGKNIVLRKAKEDDLNDIFYNVWSKKGLCKYMFWEPSTDFASAKDRLNRTIKYQNNSMNYFIALKESDEVIGFCGIKAIDENTYQESGIVISDKYQNKGLGKEVLSLLLDLAFNKLNANSFIYECVDTNVISIKLANHFSFKYINSYNTIREYDNKEFIINKYELKVNEYIKK